MSDSLNRWELIGRVALEPKLSPSKRMLRVRMATHEERNRDTQERPTHFCWIVILGEKRATSLAGLLRKGDKLFASGRMQERDWQTDDGKKRSALDLLADDLIFMGGSPREDYGTKGKDRNGN